MKHKLKYFPGYLLSLALVVSSCNGFLDTLPDNRADLQNAANIKKLLVAAYPRYQPATPTEWMSDNVDYQGDNWGRYSMTQEEAFFWADITDTGRDTPATMWSACYLAIANANQALAAIEELGRPEELEPWRGEALLCRAYGHFLLVNLFSLHYDPAKEKKNNDYDDPEYYGIPYITTPETTVDRTIYRRNVCYIYEQIDKDIEQALPLIGDAVFVAPKFHFNREAAYAFASKFNLYYCKFQKAVDYATEALGPTPKDKLRKWSDLKASNNLSVRAHLYINDQLPANFLMSTVSSVNATASRNTACRFSHSRSIAMNETTRSVGIWGNATNIIMQGTSWISQPNVVVEKLMQFTEVADPITGSIYNHNVWIHFTADETLMHRAEAWVMLAGEQGNDREMCLEKAAADINDVVSCFTTSSTNREMINNTFSGMLYYTPEQPTPKKALNPKFDFQKGGEQENFIHAILHCRRILSLHEGHRWYDIKRWGIQVDHREVTDGMAYESTVASLPPDDKRRAIQIPLKSITAGMPANPR